LYWLIEVSLSDSDTCVSSNDTALAIFKNYLEAEKIVEGKRVQEIAEMPLYNRRGPPHTGTINGPRG
jgi:hypothetical protein